MKLSQSTPAQIPIDKPSSKRAEIGIGIVHFGVGGFHRAHQARYVDLLLDDVTPYGLMRLRLLNASHQSLCYCASLTGYRLVRDATLETLSQKETP
jgi:mannitol-1-phosphate/altronate dehydrogenase